MKIWICTLADTCLDRSKCYHAKPHSFNEGECHKECQDRGIKSQCIKDFLLLVKETLDK